MRKITINHVSRIEGHATITIMLDDAGQVADSVFHVTQIRAFEKFTEGRPYYEMPSITSRICGICPVSHELASSKACDEIMAVRIPETATKLRELLHCAQIVQSHALSFFHLSAPDLLLGMDHDIETRNIAGLLAEHPADIGSRAGQPGSEHPVPPGVRQRYRHRDRLDSAVVGLQPGRGHAGLGTEERRLPDRGRQRHGCVRDASHEPERLGGEGRGGA